MTQPLSKIRIKIGTMELDYEGDPDFLNDGIEKLLETMGNLAGSLPSASIQAPEKILTLSGNGEDISNAPSGASLAGFTTSMLAAHTSAKTGPELALCAMAFLQISKGQSSNNRGDILAEMKSAGGYYNSNMAGNNSANLKTLAKNKRINEIATGKYALNSAEMKRFEAVIAEIL